MAKVESVHDFLKGKTILVTGATGFVGKVFVEKILRVQPDIKKLYLLLRASNPYLATHRLQNEVIGKDIFRVLRDKWGADFGSFISKKVVAVAGDVSLNNIKDENMRSQMFEELNVIVHTAATTNFNEREMNSVSGLLASLAHKFDVVMHVPAIPLVGYDIAIGTNTMGAFHVVNFAKSCHKLEIVLHVSTAYVCGEAEGLIVEEPLHVNGMQKGSTKLDIELEKQLIEEKLKEFKAHNTDKEVITSVMKSFGLARANLHGWPNTYVFTKAMGEILLMKMKDTLPLFVIRPTTVVSTHSEPFPGWIEGVRTIDFVVVNYGQGILTSFVGNSETILDLIPVDMVVNFMIVALMALSKGFYFLHLFVPAPSKKTHIPTKMMKPIITSSHPVLTLHFWVSFITMISTTSTSTQPLPSDVVICAINKKGIIALWGTRSKKGCKKQLSILQCEFKPPMHLGQLIKQLKQSRKGVKKRYEGK
ncbi:hypothetical protein JHK86_022216 [Glycine max]|nr:hypothetical protein JHK86_022216 [Glycine max]